MRALMFMAVMAAGIGCIVLLMRAGSSGASAPARSTPAIGSTIETDKAVLWVDPLGQVAWDRAFTNRDQAAQARAFASFETLSVAAGTPAVVTARDGDLIQLALLDGPNAGRRGWGHASLILP